MTKDEARIALQKVRERLDEIEREARSRRMDAERQVRTRGK